MPLVQIKQFKTAFVTPSDDEIREGIAIADRERCIVRIDYFVPYSGMYNLDIEPGSTLEGCRSRISKHRYPM